MTPARKKRRRKKAREFRGHIMAGWFSRDWLSVTVFKNGDALPHVKLVPVVVREVKRAD